jgi:hypothetical protein
LQKNELRPELHIHATAANDRQYVFPFHGGGRKNSMIQKQSFSPIRFVTGMVAIRGVCGKARTAPIFNIDGMIGVMRRSQDRPKNCREICTYVAVPWQRNEGQNA